MSLGINVSDLLGESLSNKAFFNKHSVLGETVTGTVVDAEVRQSRDYDDNKLEFWDDGSPRLQLVVNIQTELRDEPTEDGEEDDGMRSVYVKWWGIQRKALLTAVKKAGLSDLAEGDTFTASFVATEPNQDRKKSDTKIYEFEVKPAGPVAKANAKAA
jgi:hypothetical protein